MLSDFTQVQQVRNGKRLSKGHFSALNGQFSRSQVNRSVSNFQYSIVGLDLITYVEKMRIWP